MIIAGDVALAHDEKFRFVGFPSELLKAQLCLNLEGPILQTDAEVPSWGVYNSHSWTKSFEGWRLTAVSLANNHIHDVADGIGRTIRTLRSSGLETVGAGASRAASALPTVLQENDQTFTLLAFGWSVIGCRGATSDSPGVNPLLRLNVLRQAHDALSNAPTTRAVVILHANYEFEPYPQPAHRRLAHELIEMGVYSVVFHHSHVAGPVERVAGRTVAYGLGNWAFSYGRFFRGKLRLPPSSFAQLALELSYGGDRLHTATFRPPSLVEYEAGEGVHSEYFSRKAEFEGLNHEDYEDWFRANRVKRRGLPIYSSSENTLGNAVRDLWVSGRQKALDCASRHGWKAMRRSS